MCQNCNQESHIPSKEFASGELKNDDYSCLLSSSPVSQISTVTIMSENPPPSFTYSRKKQHGKLVALSSPEAPGRMTKRTGESESESINGCSLEKELGPNRLSKNSGKPIVYRRKNPRGGSYTGVFSGEAPCLSIISSDSPRGNRVVEELESNESSKSKRQRMIEVDSVNESWSSSKSETLLVSSSMETEVDDSIECSSSSVIAREFSEEGMSEKDLCLSLLRAHGVINGTSPSRNCTSGEGVHDSSMTGTSRLCNICSRSNSTLKMLICDNCEEAFHLSCCNPRVRKIPVDEWFCHSCSKKRCKILNKTISATPVLIGEKGRCVSSSIEESNPIVLMLRDTGPYLSGVRCGKGFQAEVPEWSGPITNDIDKIPEPLEMNPSHFVSSIELNLNERSKLSLIGNWLQCRQAVGESDSGAICGKWRRAPLFEVQTDKWECFCSVTWDPIRSDCAVPQELETDEVLRQLKYIQMLRPRLNGKRRKMERRKIMEMEQRNPDGTIMYRRYTHGRNRR